MRSLLPRVALFTTLILPTAAYGYSRPTEWPLPSGLSILHQPDARFPIVRVAVAIGAGTADTPPRQRPLAHLAEHVAFRTNLDGVAAFPALRAAGCEVNGSTAHDYTAFEAACPVDAAPLAVRFATSLATHSFDGISEEVVNAEKRIVLAETTERIDDGDSSLDGVLQGLFTGDHPYAAQERVPDDLLALGLADVRAFFEAHYVPSKTVIAVQGDLDARSLASLIATNAGDGFADPRQRKGDFADWPAGAIQIQWLSPLSATWFRDPGDPTRPLDPGSTGPVMRVDTPVPTPDTLPRQDHHAGIWPQVRVAWYLPPARRDTWFPIQEAAVFAEDTLEKVFAPEEVVSGGCAPFLGTRGSALICQADLETEDHLERIGARIASAFASDPGHDMEVRQRALHEADALRWRGIVTEDTFGMEELAELSLFRLVTGRFDVESARAQALGGGAAFRVWTELRHTWLRPERAVTSFLSPEARDPVVTDGAAMDGAAPTRLTAWPAPALGAASANDGVETVLENGLRTVVLPLPSAQVGAWRLAVPSLPGLEHLDRVLDAAIRTPDRFEGIDIRYNWNTDTEDGGTILRLNQRGAWEPLYLLRALWATVEARRVGNVELAYHRYVKRYVYAGRGPWNWRWRVWRRATREDPERDGLPEIDEAIHTKGAVEAYLEARFQPSRATLFLVGREAQKAGEQIAKEMGDWRATSPPAPDLPTARRRAPVPEAVVFDANGRGRTVSVTWACPLDSTGAPDPLVGDLVSEVASLRLWDVARASSGLTYTPYAWTDIQWGGVDLMLQASTELGQERRLLEAFRGVVRELADGGAGPLLGAARRQVLAAELHEGASVFGLAQSLSRRVLYTGSLAELRARRAALATVDAGVVSTQVKSCATTGVALLVGPADEVAHNLEGGGLPVRVFDWRAEQRALVTRFAPAMLGREETWMRNARGE